MTICEVVEKHLPLADVSARWVPAAGVVDEISQQRREAGVREANFV
jgi:hypothetical protein